MLLHSGFRCQMDIAARNCNTEGEGKEVEQGKHDTRKRTHGAICDMGVRRPKACVSTGWLA